MSETAFPEELVEMCEQMDELFWDQNPTGGSHEFFWDWAEVTFCREHLDAPSLATGLSCLRCAVEAVLDEIDGLGAPRLSS